MGQQLPDKTDQKFDAVALNNYPVLLSYMEAKSYGKQYIRFIEKEINWILDESESCDWKTYDDIYQAYVDKWKNKHTLANRTRGLLVIKRFDLESQMPDGRKHYRKPSNYDYLSEEFKLFIETFLNAVKPETNKSYYKGIEHSACSFLLRLQKNGIDILDSITETSVFDIFAEDDKINGSHGFRYSVKTAFKINAPYYHNGTCLKIISCLPSFQRRKKNIQYLTKDEIKQVESMLDNDTSLSLQDRAIGLLAYYTGLRSCDITALSLDDIDWERDIIHVRQQKTGVPLTLSMRATAGNALFDYITKERPKNPGNIVFLTVNAPYRRLHTGNLHAICVAIMKKAGIRNNAGDRRGFHLFRHHLATSLLENGVQQPVISSTLGHQSPDSLNSYLSSDFLHLKECALSIDCFPVREKVFQS
jgi:integrase